MAKRRGSKGLMQNQMYHFLQRLSPDVPCMIKLSTKGPKIMPWSTPEQSSWIGQYFFDMLDTNGTFWNKPVLSKAFAKSRNTTWVLFLHHLLMLNEVDVWSASEGKWTFATSSSPYQMVAKSKRAPLPGKKGCEDRRKWPRNVEKRSWGLLLESKAFLTTSLVCSFWLK